jgi:hypothetical protein
MDSDKINRWLKLLANFGVVLGLALLVYELRQSQNLVETEAAIGRLNEMQEAQSELALSDSLAEIQIKARAEGAQALFVSFAPGRSDSAPDFRDRRMEKRELVPSRVASQECSAVFKFREALQSLPFPEGEELTQAEQMARFGPIVMTLDHFENSHHLHRLGLLSDEQ